MERQNINAWCMIRGRGRRLAAGGVVLVGALGLAIFQQACASGALTQAADGRSVGDSTSIAVKNYNMADVNLSVFYGGTRQFLGVVGSMSQDEFRIPTTSAVTTSQLRLVADPIGSNEPVVSDRILISAGQSIAWTLTQPFRYSYLTVH